MSWIPSTEALLRASKIVLPLSSPSLWDALQSAPSVSIHDLSAA